MKLAQHTPGVGGRDKAPRYHFHDKKGGNWAGRKNNGDKHVPFQHRQNELACNSIAVAHHIAVDQLVPLACRVVRVAHRIPVLIHREDCSASFGVAKGCTPLQRLGYIDAIIDC